MVLKNVNKYIKHKFTLNISLHLLFITKNVITFKCFHELLYNSLFIRRYLYETFTGTKTDSLHMS